MRPFEISPEAELRRESVQRTLLELFEQEDWNSLLAHAELLNQLWCQQREISRWLAAEAAENLNVAVMAGKQQT